MKKAEILRSAASELGNYIDLDKPSYHDYQTPHELVVISRKYEELQADLDAYKAHMAKLKIGLEATLDCAISTQACDSILSDAMIDLLAKTPAQSLNDVRAKAVTDLITECSYSTQVNGIATSIIDADSAISYADRLLD